MRLFTPWSLSFAVLLLLICLVQAHGQHHHHRHASRSLHNAPETSPNLLKRQLGDARCDANNECADKSCCNGKTGWCGRDPDHCAAGTCLSNCDAKADCGIGAELPGKECPLNVCCGKSGYCGTTHNFCATDLGCQSNCPQPGSTGKLSSGYEVGDLTLTRQTEVSVLHLIDDVSLVHD
jgi:chitinase